MTWSADDQRELDANLARLKAGWEAERFEIEVRAPRRAAEEAERLREAEAAAHRERERAKAAHAALQWTGWTSLPQDVVELQRHAIDLLLELPGATVQWLEKSTRSEELVSASVAVAFIKSRTIACRPIIDADSAIVFDHEWAHLVVPQTGTRLQQELAAWSLARERALVFNDATQARMVNSLQTYACNAGLTDVLDVLAIEAFCSSTEFRREQQRRLELRLAKEQEQLDEALRHRPCAHCHDRPATTLIVNRPYCAACGTAAMDEAKWRAVDIDVERQRRVRARMRPTSSERTESGRCQR